MVAETRRTSQSPGGVALGNTTLKETVVIEETAVKGNRERTVSQR